jgi:pantoate kinase
MSETIGRQAASYRQGLVLGLTMAEIMLMLVFCILIAVGVGLANERAKSDDAILHLRKLEVAAAADKAMVETIKRNPRLADLLARATRSASQREIDEFWRKLVESNDAVANLERQGVSLVALKEESSYFARLQRLLNEGIDLDKIARGVALASAIDEAVSATAMTKLTPQQVAVLIEKGIAASTST